MRITVNVHSNDKRDAIAALCMAAAKIAASIAEGSNLDGSGDYLPSPHGPYYMFSVERKDIWDEGQPAPKEPFNLTTG